ncbi:MAG: DUF5329 domain-containing protein [Candidatus Sumerlaeia bacterium]|nr:DUF5329 domain-containing protein [Candidatus Sumerlaeia bacterium]
MCKKTITPVLFVIMTTVFIHAQTPSPQQQAEANAVEAQKAFLAAQKFIAGWWDQRDTDTALIPENLRDPKIRNWTPKNSAADNWPYMVIAARFVLPSFYQNECLKTLADEQRLTNRVRRLADDFNLMTNQFLFPQPDMTRIIFGSAEYAKDGLIPITEILGPKTPYFQRMRDLADDLLAESRVQTRFGLIPASDHEVNGDMLQVLSRLWWATRDDRYLDMALRIAQHYLFDAPPARANVLRLRDHGGEIVNGLCEAYLAAKQGRPDAAAKLREPLLANLDRILEIGRNDDGLLYNQINAATGEIQNKGAADTWGYILDGYYALYLSDGIERYRDAVRKALAALPKYRDYSWEGKDGADGMADALESAVTLLRWEPDAAAFDWCAHTYHKMLAVQKPDGIIEGWHGDGNVIRSALMWAFYLSQGVYVEPWREDVAVGAVRNGDAVVICVKAGNDWSGRLVFDRPRHRDYFNMAADYPRINSFAEWFAPQAATPYRMVLTGRAEPLALSGGELHAGIPIAVKGGEPFYCTVTPAAGGVTAAPVGSSPAKTALTEQQKIAALLDAVSKAKDLTFIRNDAEWPASAARQLMESKYGKAKDNIKTVEEFIEQIASRSSTTGRVYQVKFKDGRTTESAYWLRARLKEIEAGKF